MEKTSCSSKTTLHFQFKYGFCTIFWLYLLSLFGAGQFKSAVIFVLKKNSLDVSGIFLFAFRSYKGRKEVILIWKDKYIPHNQQDQPAKPAWTGLSWSFWPRQLQNLSLFHTFRPSSFTHDLSTLSVNSALNYKLCYDKKKNGAHYKNERYWRKKLLVDKRRDLWCADKEDKA